MPLAPWLKRTLAALFLVFGLGILTPSTAFAAGTSSTTPGCGQVNSDNMSPATAHEMENSKLLPVVRWSDATGSIHTRLDGKWYGDISQKLQRNVADSSMMSFGNAEFSTATEILEMAGDFCPGNEASVHVDQTTSQVGRSVLSLDNPFAWAWVGLLLSGIIANELWKSRRTGRVNWNPIARFGGLTVVLALMVTAAGQSNGSNLARFSPGWIINGLETSTGQLATAVGSFGDPTKMSDIESSIASKSQVDMAKTNKLSCVNYEARMIKEYQAKYLPSGSFDGRGIVPLLMNRMWMNTGYRAFVETQYGADNMYGPMVACRGLEWSTGQSATDQAAVEGGSAGGTGSTLTTEQEIADQNAKLQKDTSAAGQKAQKDATSSDGSTYDGKIVAGQGGTPAASNVNGNYWYGFESDNNQRWDTDMIMVAACGYNGKWFVNPGWIQAKDKDNNNPTDGVYNHDNGDSDHGATPKICEDAWNGATSNEGKDTFANWQDGKGTLSNGTPPNGAITTSTPYNAGDVHDAGGANPRDFISNLHGYTTAGSAMAALLYPVTGGVILVVFGGLGLVIFGLRYAMLLAILAIMFVSIWSVIKNSTDPFVRFFKMLIGAMFIAFGYLMILSIISILTSMFLDLSDTFDASSSGIGSVIWTAMAPLFSIALFRWFWDKFIKAPNPLSLRGGLGYGRAAAEGALGAGAVGLMARGARAGAGRLVGNGPGASAARDLARNPASLPGSTGDGTPAAERQGAMLPGGPEATDPNAPAEGRTGGMDGLGDEAAGVAAGALGAEALGRDNHMRMPVDEDQAALPGLDTPEWTGDAGPEVETDLVEGGHAPMTAAEAGIIGTEAGLAGMDAAAARRVMDARERQSATSLAERARRGAALHGDLNQIGARKAAEGMSATGRMAGRINSERSGLSGRVMGNGKVLGSSRLGSGYAAYSQMGRDVTRGAAIKLAESRLGRTDRGAALADRINARRDARANYLARRDARLANYSGEGARNMIARAAIRTGYASGTAAGNIRSAAKMAPKAVGGALAVGALAGGAAPLAMAAGGAMGIAYASRAIRNSRTHIAGSSARQARNISLADQADVAAKHAATQRDRSIPSSGIRASAAGSSLSSRASQVSSRPADVNGTGAGASRPANVTGTGTPATAGGSRELSSNGTERAASLQGAPTPGTGGSSAPTSGIRGTAAGATGSSRLASSGTSRSARPAAGGSTLTGSDSPAAPTSTAQPRQTDSLTPGGNGAQPVQQAPQQAQPQQVQQPQQAQQAQPQQVQQPQRQAPQQVQQPQQAQPQQQAPQQVQQPQQQAAQQARALADRQATTGAQASATPAATPEAPTRRSLREAREARRQQRSDRRSLTGRDETPDDITGRSDRP